MRVLVPLVVALAVLPLPAGAAPRENPVLDAIVGTNDAFQITLNDATGAKVSIIPPGTYTVVVHDNSAIHNFHLASNEDPTVDFRTDVDFVGTKTFTVTFRPATRYAYACEPHWQVMNGSFLTERAGGSPPPPPPPPPPRVARLAATVTASGKVVLSRTSVPAGRYRVTVSDRSARDNFHLRGRGVDRRTGMAFRGSAVWTLKLVRGTYVYGSDRIGANRRLRVR
jgi:plastocyanin